MTPDDDRVERHKRCHQQLKLTKKIVDGQKLTYYSCQKCGLNIYSASEAQKLLDAERGRRYGKKRTISAKEWILLMLGAQEAKELYGAISLMKQIFLAIKELAPEIGIGTHNVTFFPYKYGPYSREVARALDELIDDGLIDVKGRRSTNKEIFKLTRTGKQEARNIKKRFSHSTVQRLALARKSWDQLQNKGILKKVYSEYPYYRKKSKIAELVLKGRRRA